MTDYDDLYRKTAEILNEYELEAKQENKRVVIENVRKKPCCGVCQYWKRIKGIDGQCTNDDHKSAKMSYMKTRFKCTDADFYRFSGENTAGCPFFKRKTS